MPDRYPMRIAVISDSHDDTPTALPGLLEGADEIWHLGDVMDPRQLVELELLGKPMQIVAGNCDAWPWPRTRRLTRGAVSYTHLTLPTNREV